MGSRAISSATCFLVAGLLLAACSHSTIVDRSGLMEALRADGHTVTQGESITQPFFSVPGSQVNVDDQIVYAFEYADEKTLASETSDISSDGSSVNAVEATWIAPPHFFKNGKLLVLYLGQDAKILASLKKQLARQFAGK